MSKKVNSATAIEQMMLTTIRYKALSQILVDWLHNLSIKASYNNFEFPSYNRCYSVAQQHLTFCRDAD